MAENAGRSEYNGLQLELNRRFDRGLAFGIAYTYSESYDNASDRRYRLFNPLDDSLDWGPSNFDTPHVLVINAIYELPFWRQAGGLRNALLGGWTVTGVYQYQSGIPFHIGTGEDFAGIGSGNETQLWNACGGHRVAEGRPGVLAGRRGRQLLLPHHNLRRGADCNDADTGYFFRPDAELGRLPSR